MHRFQLMKYTDSCSAVHVPPPGGGFPDADAASSDAAFQAAITVTVTTRPFIYERRH
jgi:hypothetical protein